MPLSPDCWVQRCVPPPPSLAWSSRRAGWPQTEMWLCLHPAPVVRRTLVSMSGCQVFLKSGEGGVYKGWESKPSLGSKSKCGVRGRWDAPRTCIPGKVIQRLGTVFPSLKCRDICSLECCDPQIRLPVGWFHWWWQSELSDTAKSMTMQAGDSQRAL